ncbi:MAG: efflux RND transporter periplasmic adaptor subunit [Desulfobacteraceae bacterium]|nr:efflux RND transporter periplasmic adaptor subunit [Desulfobacteraceae bacterium]
MPLLIVLSIAVGPFDTWGAEIVEAITKPSADVLLSFIRAGRVAEVLVKEGDIVEQGQLLVRLDDDAERVQLEQLKAQAANSEKVQASAADLAQKRADHKKLQWAKSERAATDWEVEHAGLNVQIGESSLRLAGFEHRQDGLKYEEAKVQVERMRLYSPVVGKVEQVDIEPGESAQALSPVIRVVQIDPLWVDAPVPSDLARTLKPNQKAYVRFRCQDCSEKGEEAKVIHVSAVAVAATETLRVRLELPNPAQRSAGERVKVSFSPFDAP